MEMFNRAVEGAAAFKELLRKVQVSGEDERAAVQSLASSEVVAWNAEVERKRAEKKARQAMRPAYYAK